MNKPEVLWFISGTWRSGNRFFYYGSGFSTRRSAIKDHEESLGQEWRYCKLKGDCAVKCIVSPVRKPK